jgi:hypothetical protein
MFDSSQYAADSAKSGIDKMMQEVIVARDELAKLKEEIGDGGIIPVKPYPYGKAMANVRSYANPTEARQKLESLFEDSKSISAANELAAAHNRKLLEKLKGIIKAMGITTTVRRKVPRKRDKYETVNADWFRDMESSFPIYSGFSSIESIHKDKMAAVAKWEAEIAQQKANEQRERDAFQKKNQYVQLAASMATRYGLEPTAEPDDVFYAVIGSDKYLKLSYWLERNRGDWSDGHYYADCGLNGFTIEDEQDREVSDCIYGYIDDWDGDGRVFRDCEWNYGRLYKIAETRNKQAVDDYTALMEVKPS